MYKILPIIRAISIGLIIAGTLGKAVCAEVKKPKSNLPPQHQAASSKSAGKRPAKKANSTQPKPGLIDTQRAAAEAVLKSLRKLDAATEVGVSFEDYHTRLIDTKADVNEGLRALPDGPLKAVLSDAMQAHQDASTFWNECVSLKNRGDIHAGASGPILKKYGLSLPTLGQREEDAAEKALADFKVVDAKYHSITDSDHEALKDKLVAKQEELNNAAEDDLAAAFKINDEDEKRLLSGIWKVARQKEKDAETALNVSKGLKAKP